MRRPLRFFFSGYFVSAILIILEVIAIFLVLLELSAYSVYVFLGAMLVSLISVVVVINANYNPEYKVTWMAIIVFMPIFGTLLFVLFRRKKMSRKDARMSRNTLSQLDLYTDKATIDILRKEAPRAAGKAQAILTDAPASGLFVNTSSRFFAYGEDMYEAMLEDLACAQRFIFLEYFIIEGGAMWDGIHEILKAKAEAGIEVRILYDDVGSMSTIPHGFLRKMEQEGIKCQRFGKVSPKISSAHNNRDHRKILVIDGKVAYTGGINIADEYINEINRFGYWKDGGIRLSGDGVIGLTRIFLLGWDVTAHTHSEYDRYLSVPDCSANAGDGGYYLTYDTGPSPIYRRHVGERAFLDIINQAERYLYITTPYLIINHDLTDALRGAALRGVDVRIITPSSADKKIVKLMTKSSYPHLMEAGVKIYEYAPGFIHEKTVVSDDDYAIIGTINFDYRSLIHHYEDAVWIYKSPIIPEIREEFERTLTESNLMTRTRARLTVKETIVRWLMRMFAPLL